MLFRRKRALTASWAACARQVELLESRVLLSVDTSGSPAGLSPAMIEQAYDLKNIVFTTGGNTVSANGAGETIAVVDAYADPYIASDLQTFDANFGITNDNASGQFVLTVATPEGSVSTDPGWDTEQSLDVEWAHAIAPEANILLVEAASDSFADLTSAVVWAESQPGVVSVSMSWGSTPEFAGETQYDQDFTTPSGHQGVTFVASSGDNGVPNYPSTSSNVLAVGGTTLTVNDSGDYISESPWSDSGGGVSPYEGTDKPDVAYDANPSTGFLVYDSVPYQGASGWQVVGGTSAGAPQWAAIIALVDQGRSLLSLGSLDGPTQTIPDIDALPSSDFNGVSGDGNTGLGSPVGEQVISGLVGGGITSVSSSGTPSTGASQLVFVQQPTEVTAGAAISPSVIVDVEDSDGAVVTSDDSSVTISIASGSGALDGTLTVAAVDGVATFSNLSLDIAGSYTLKAGDGSLTSATSGSFTVIPAAASRLVFVQEPTNVTAGNTLAPITIKAEDQFGNLAEPGISTATLNVASGPGTLTGGTTAEVVNGQAVFNSVSITTSGAYTLRVSDGSLTTALSSSFTVVAAVASNVAFAVQPDTVVAGNIISPAVTVEVEDQFGNLVTSNASSVTLSVSTGPGSLNGTATVQAVDGVATFDNLSLTRAGSYTLQATDGSLTTAVSNSFAVTPAAENRLSFVQQPGDVTAGGTINPSLTVAVEDQFGNLITGDSSSVTLTVNTGPGLLNGTVTVQADGGVATFTDLSVTTAGNYTLLATDGSLASATTGSFSVTPAAASRLVFVQQPGNAAMDASLSPAVVVAVEDQYGNLVTSESSNVTISVARGPLAVLDGTLTEPAVNGFATFSDLSLNAGGNFQLAATDGAITADSESFAVAVEPAPVGSTASHLAFVQEPQTLTAGVATASAFVIDVEDQAGEFVTSGTSRVTLSILSGPRGSALHGTATVLSQGGVATFSNVDLTVAGDYTFQVKDGRLTTAVSDTVLVEPSAPVKLLYIHQPGNAIAGNAIDAPVVVELKDRFNNIATNADAVVTLSIASGPAGAVVGGDASVTADNGLATFSDVLLDTAGHYRLTASDGGLTVKSQSIAIAPAAAAALTFEQQSADAVAGHAPALPIKISVTDAFGNAVANGTTVTLALASAPDFGTINGRTTAVTHNGIAEFAGVTFPTAGEYTLAATAGSAVARSAPITVSPAVASRLVFLQAPANVTTNTAFSVKIELLDRYGNVVTNNSSVVTVTLGSHPAQAVLSGPYRSPVTDGVATFSGLTLDSIGTYTLRFEDESLHLISPSFDVI